MASSRQARLVDWLKHPTGLPPDPAIVPENAMWTAQEIVEFAEKLDDKHIYFPGWWEKGPITSEVCNWRFCGSTISIRRQLPISARPTPTLC